MSKSQVGRSETRQRLGVRALCAALRQTRKADHRPRAVPHFTLGHSLFGVRHSPQCRKERRRFL